MHLGILGGQDHPLRQSSQVSLDFLGGPVDLLSLQIRGYQESRVHPWVLEVLVAQILAFRGLLSVLGTLVLLKIQAVQVAQVDLGFL